jgi:hypothetical protein
MLPLEEQAERWLGAKEVKYDLKARRKMMMS